MSSNDTEAAASVDWSRHENLTLWDVTCGCGARYRSHVQTNTGMPGAKLPYGMVWITKDPCPKCARHSDIRHAKPLPKGDHRE